MGTGPFAIPSCDRILSSGHTVSLVVTRPVVDPAAKKQPVRPVFSWAVEHGLQVFEPPSINSPEAIQRLKIEAADLFFVCDYGQILSAECLNASRLGGINLHGSLLPRHRGAAPVQWTILSGDPDAGATVILMNAKLDAGPAVSVVRTTILPDETSEHLESRLAILGAKCTEEAIEKLSAVSVIDSETIAGLGVQQDRLLITKAPRFSKQDGQLDFRLSANYLVRLVRACQPWPGTFAELAWRGSDKKMRLLIRSARAVEESSARPAGEAWQVTQSELDSWKVNELGESWPQAIAVSTGNGLLLIGRVQPAGRREMSVEEFLRGHALTNGGTFVLPASPVKQLVE